VHEGPPTTRWAALLSDLHFWIPLAALALGVLLLRWLA
jgi:hypothetical protein